VPSLVEAISPSRLGTDFRWLLGSSWASNVGDGLALAAGPLLVASETQDPVLIALAALLQRVPWLLFGLYAGVVADRLDRRSIVIVVELLRAAVLAVLAVAIVTGAVNVGVVLVAMFLLGTAETFADVTTTTILPMVVEPRDLGVANARLMTGFITANQLVGPPVGAALFGLGAAVPFVAHGVLVAFGALLVARMRNSLAPPPPGEHAVRREIVDGVRWLWRHPPLRTLTLTIVTFNVTYGAAWSVLVLYAAERLGLGEVGFGLLVTVSAFGGVVGSAVYAPLERRVSLATIMRVGLLIETCTHLVLAVTTKAWVAMAVLFVFGAHAAIWGTTSSSVRQRAVPAEYQGRVGSVYLIGVQAGIVVGAALAGPIARVTGITGPFWFAFAGSALLLALIWRELAHIAHAPEAPEAPDEVVRNA
jgi:predicted MFS family arabinose efflux permease